MDTVQCHFVDFVRGGMGGRGGHRDEIHKVLSDHISIGWEGGVTSSLPNQQGFLNVSISKDGIKHSSLYWPGGSV